MAAINKKLYISLFFIGGFMAALCLINNWLIGKMDESQTQLGSENKNQTQPASASVSVRSERPGIPKIDPLNDPLAPVRGDQNPFAKDKQKSSVNESHDASSKSEPVFEFPNKSLILAQ